MELILGCGINMQHIHARKRFITSKDYSGEPERAPHHQVQRLSCVSASHTYFHIQWQSRFKTSLMPTVYYLTQWLMWNGMFKSREAKITLKTSYWSMTWFSEERGSGFSIDVSTRWLEAGQWRLVCLALRQSRSMACAKSECERWVAESRKQSYQATANVE